MYLTYYEDKYTILIYDNGGKLYYVNNKLHREDGPAIEYNSGYKEWCLNGQNHREDGPAVEYIGGDKRWFLHGKEYFVNSVDELIIANIIE